MNPADLVAQYGYVAVFAIIGLESLGVPLPGETTLVAAAVFAGATHRLSIVGVIAAASAGAIIGDNTGYLLGHWGGYRLLMRFGGRIGFTAGRIKIARYLFLRFGGAVVFFGRFVSILRAYAAFLAGTTRMPWRWFIFYNAAGGVLWSVAYGTAAYALGRAVDTLSRQLTVGFAIAGVAAIVVAAFFIRRGEERLLSAAERAFPEPRDVLN